MLFVCPLLVGLRASACSSESPDQAVADYMFSNANVITMSDNQPKRMQSR